MTKGNDQTRSGLAALSFTRQAEDRIEIWPAGGADSGISPGGYAASNEVGRARADELITYMRENEAPSVLGHIVEAIVSNGLYGPVEIGFFNQVALYAIRHSPRNAGDQVATEPMRRRPTLHIVARTG